MKILVANHWLKKWGGSETFTYTLVEELVRLGHNVDLFTIHPGLVSKKIQQDFKVALVDAIKTYDLVLANHNTTVSQVFTEGNSDYNKIIQTCHGIVPKLEQPSKSADKHVSISEEVQNHLKRKGYKSTLILNGINCNRFAPFSEIFTRPQTILSMVFTDEANKVIKEACDILSINLITLNKHKNPVFNVAYYINKADMVIGLGRCAYEAMACGRPVIVYDNRPYMPSFADGYLDAVTLPESIKHNCSGRRYKRHFTVHDLVNEIKKYDPADGERLRTFALQELNIQNQVQKYLTL